MRFSYVNVFAPRRNPDGTPGKYSVCVIIPKSDKDAYRIFEEAYKNAATLGKSNKWNGRIPSKVSLPLHDGDEERPDDAAFKDCWYFNCSSTNKPGVRVREAGMVIEAMGEDELYSGCYGAVTVNLFPYSSNGNVGVGVGLNNIIKTEDGEKLSGGRSAGRSADADFGDMAD